MTADSENENDSDFDTKRRLCPDGSCVGVIGPDGKCSECGRMADEQTANEALSSAEGDDHVVKADARASADAGFDPARRLCSDEACIGIIGDDGRCKVCGKPA